jgi:radical SAM superfamily enzyme
VQFFKAVQTETANYTYSNQGRPKENFLPARIAECPIRNGRVLRHGGAHCNLSTWETEAGGSQVQDQSELHSGETISKKKKRKKLGTSGLYS